ncbi:hypothetical protein BST61_g5677 [Cercospora zeina]
MTNGKSSGKTSPRLSKRRLNLLARATRHASAHLATRTSSTMSSSSTAGDATAPKNNPQNVEAPKKVQLIINGPREGLEHMLDYQMGGHHPVHLGDVLGPEGRYRVINKLGKGGFANVWLCVDTDDGPSRYVALKILMADYSKEDCPELRALMLNHLLEHDSKSRTHICLPLSHFRINGPNGSHLCFVYPVLGPRASRALKNIEHSNAALRCFALQVASSVAAIHRIGLCHGDLNASNILLRTTGLNELSENMLIETLGQPRRAEITVANGDEHHDPRAPQYLVYPVDFTTIESKFLTGDACVTDFGECFEAQEPPERLGIPLAYRAPELILGGSPGQACDLWALACILFEIRTGRKLFGTFDNDTGEYLYNVAMKLGKFPKPMWSNWEDRTDTFEEEADDLGRVVLLDKEDTYATYTTGGLFYDPHSIREAIFPGWFDITEPSYSPRKMCDREIELLADLLEKLCAYEPEERLSAQEASDHEWFKFSEEDQKTSYEEEQTGEEQQETSEEEPVVEEAEQANVGEQKTSAKQSNSSEEGVRSSDSGQKLGEKEGTTSEEAPERSEAEQKTRGEGEKTGKKAQETSEEESKPKDKKQ